MGSFENHQDCRIRRPRTRRAPAPRRREFRPRLEGLEGRTVLSSYTAATVSDLIADINASNNGGGSNTITLVAGNSFSLTAVDNTTDGATGLPVIAANDSLTIAGNSDTIARSGAPGTPAFRLFEVAAGASLTLQSLTLQGGLASGAYHVVSFGGAVYNKGSLVLNSAIVQNNIAQGQPNVGFGGEGGAIYSNGSLTLEGGAKVQNNQAIGGVGHNAVPRNRGGGPYPPSVGCNGYGGGIYVAAGTVTLTNATLAANSAQGGQGGNGLRLFNGAAGGTGYGGALYLAGGAVTMSGANISANTAKGGQGGGSSYKGGNGGNGLGGGLYVAGGTLTLPNDTVTSNSALSGPAGVGVNGSGLAGQGVGGGLYIGTLATVYLDTFTQANVINNTASTSDPNIHGTWHGI